MQENVQYSLYKIKVLESNMLTKLMANFRIIWNDVKHGENIGVYVTIVAAIAIAVLGLIGVRQELIPSLTLGILSLFAISILNGRRKMESITQKIEEIKDTLDPAVHIEAYKDQSESDEVLKEWVKNNRPRKAIIIDYTSHTIREFLRYLLDNQIQVDLYLQTVQTIKSLGIQRQYGLLLDGLKEIYVEFSEELKNGQMKLMYYSVLPSILGVRFDEDILCIGWYVWEPLFDESAVQDEGIRTRIRNLRSRKQPLSDRVRIWGHTQPRLIVHKNTPQFEIFNKMFTSQIDHFELYNDINRDSKEFDEMKPEAIATSAKMPKHK
jgi:hypothetical protein